MLSRSFLGLCFLICPVTLWAGCGQSAIDGDVIQIGSTKPSLFGLPREYRALHQDLEKLFESRVVFRSQPNGEALAQQLALGNVDFAMMTATEFCSVKDPSKLTLLATATNSLNRPARKAYIVVRANSHVKEITDIAGKRFAFGRHGDLLTDTAAKVTLEKAGVPMNKLLPELLSIAIGGRLFRGHEVGLTIIADPTINAGVVDEVDYAKMPDTGGNFILGPSKDQLKIVGETQEVPEMVFVAGIGTDPEQSIKLESYLLKNVQSAPAVCKQLGIIGFVNADRAAYMKVGRLLARGP